MRSSTSVRVHLIAQGGLRRPLHPRPQFPRPRTRASRGPRPHRCRSNPPPPTSSHIAASASPSQSPTTAALPSSRAWLLYAKAVNRQAHDPAPYHMVEERPDDMSAMEGPARRALAAAPTTAQSPVSRCGRNGAIRPTDGRAKEASQPPRGEGSTQAPARRRRRAGRPNGRSTGGWGGGATATWSPASGGKGWKDGGIEGGGDRMAEVKKLIRYVPPDEDR